MRLSVILMLVYLAAATTLALRVDRAFFLNDAVALVLFAVLLGGMMAFERSSRRRL